MSKILNDFVVGYVLGFALGGDLIVIDSERCRIRFLTDRATCMRIVRYLEALLRIFDPRASVDYSTEKSSGRKVVSVRSKKIVALLLDLGDRVLSDQQHFVEKSSIHFLLGVVSGFIDSSGSIEYSYHGKPLIKTIVANERVHRFIAISLRRLRARFFGSSMDGKPLMFVELSGVGKILPCVKNTRCHV